MQDKLELARLQKEKRRNESKGNYKEVAASCNKIGELLCRLGEYDDAIVEHEQELALSEALEDRLGAAIAHRRIGECFSEMGQYEKALDHQKLHLKLAVRCSSLIEQQRAHATIGRTYYQQAESFDPGSLEQKQALDNSEASFKKSLSSCESLKAAISELEYSEMKARLMMNFGLIYDCRGNVDKCGEYFKRAIQLAEKWKLYEELYRCQFNLAGIYQRIGNLSQAIRHVDLSIKCAVTMKDRHAERESLILKGTTFLHLGDISAAKRTLKKAYKLNLGLSEASQAQLVELLKNAVKLGHLQDELTVLAHDAEGTLSKSVLQQTMKIYEKLGDTAAKLECFKFALDSYISMEKIATRLDLHGPELIPIYVSIAQTYSDLRRHKDAITYYQKELALRLGEPEQMCRTWLNIAEAQSQAGDDYDVIVHSYLEALHHAREAQHFRLEAAVLDLLKNLHGRHGYDKQQLQMTAELEKLCSLYDIDPDDDLLNSSPKTDDESSDGELDLDDISDGSDVCDGDDSRKQSLKMKVKKNEKGESPLHRACIEGNIRKVKLLLESGHPVNPRDYCGWLPLHEAANHGFVEIVEYLLDKGARIDDRGGEHCNGITPLHDACSCGNVAVVKLLIERGASVVAKDDDGKTPLDSLMEYYNRSKDELSIDELKEVKFVERLLRTKMTVSNPALYKNGVSRVSNVPAQSNSTADVKVLSQFRQRHLSRRMNRSAAASDVEPSSDEEEEEPRIATHSRPRVNRSSTKKQQKDRESSGEDDESDSIPYTPNLGLENIRKLHNPATASLAYKDAIESLRSVANRRKPDDVPKCPPPARPVPALIDEQEVVGDNWLIDDTKSSKRKSNNVENVFREMGNHSETKRPRHAAASKASFPKTDSSFKNPHPVKRKRTTIRDSDDNDSDELCDHADDRTADDRQYFDDDYQNSCDTGLFTGTTTAASAATLNTATVIDLDDENEITEFVSQSVARLNCGSTSKRRTQLKLTSFGNVVNSSGGRIRRAIGSGGSGGGGDDATSVPVAQQPATNIPIQQQQLQPVMPRNAVTAVPPVNPLKMRLKVHIQENIILVPVLQSDVNQTVSWLAGQAADRYHQLYNMRPIGLSLALHDGAKLAPNDIISSTFLDNEELFGTVEKWDLQPLSSRYSDACYQLQCTTYGNIKRLMTTAERTGCLQLNDLALRSPHFQPIARALQFQSALRELELPGNRLGDEGFEKVLAILPTLPNLTVLDVSCNGLTDVSLCTLATALETTPGKMLQLLEKFSLSYNSLGNVCCVPLSRCIARLSRLRHLQLASCELTVKFFDQNRSSLTDALQGCNNFEQLDIQLNNFGSTGIELLLRCLNLSRLLSINLSNTVDTTNSSQMTRHICQQFSQVGCSIETIRLDCCHISSESTSDICRLIRQCRSLRRLSLSGNVGLMSADVSAILLTTSDVSGGGGNGLSDIELVSCGLSSPLDIQFLDALSERLQREDDDDSVPPLRRLRMTVAKLCKVDTDSLGEIWTGRWHERGVVTVCGDTVLMTVSEDANTNCR